MGTHKAIARTKGTRMGWSKDTVLFPIDTTNSLARGKSPSKKDNTTGAHFNDGIYDFLGKFFPSSIGMAVGFMGPNGQASI